MFAKNIKWIFLIILSLIWGSSFILIKKGLIGLTPLQLGSLRIIFAAVFLLAIGHKTLLKIPQNQWKYIVLTAFFGTFIPAYLFAIAETQLDSSITAILNSLTPLNTLVLGVLAFGLGVQRNQVMGVVIGLVGSALLILSGANNHPEQNYYYAFLVIIASICYAANVNLIKKYLSDLSPLTISTGNFIVLLLPSLIVLFSTGFSGVWSSGSVQNAIVYILILGVIGTGVANILFFKLIQISSPVFATSVTYLIPIVAFFWGLLDHEKLTPIQYMGAFIILIGVYISAQRKNS